MKHEDQKSLIVVAFTGDTGEGAVVGVRFWTLAGSEAKLTISNFRVLPAIDSLQLRWRNEELPCMRSYMVRICSMADSDNCQDKLVTADVIR